MGRNLVFYTVDKATGRIVQKYSRPASHFVMTETPLDCIIVIPETDVEAGWIDAKLDMRKLKYPINPSSP